MIMTILDQHIKNMRLALLDSDMSSVAVERDWLMGEITAALLEQDEKTMNILRGHLADLAPLVDEYGDAKPGDRWRATWEILRAFCVTYRPLEQFRLAAPGKLSGLLLRHIHKTPGVTPTELVNRVSKNINHVSNTLRALAEQGLVQRIPQGRKKCYYLTAMGREALAQQQPVAAVEKTIKGKPSNLFKLDHLRDGRLKNRETSRLPARW